jgi:8-oxo-dGTP diphosphatase
VSVPGARLCIQVVAAALFDEAGRVLIAERPAGKHMAGSWEFPGGKRGADEAEAAALVRELAEELGIEVWAARPSMRLRHAYPDRDVELALWVVVRYAGTPVALEGQRLKWVVPQKLERENLLEADRPFIEALTRGAVP